MTPDEAHEITCLACAHAALKEVCAVGAGGAHMRA